MIGSHRAEQLFIRSFEQRFSNCVRLNPSHPQKSGPDLLKYVLSHFKTVIKSNTVSQLSSVTQHRDQWHVWWLVLCQHDWIPGCPGTRLNVTS